MKVEDKGHTVIIKDTKADLKAFEQTISGEYNSYKERNIVLDLSGHKNLTLNDVLLFLKLSDRHRKAKRSFVLVANEFDFNEVPDEMVVVPTVLEATDIIEMEEIERDLGF